MECSEPGAIRDEELFAYLEGEKVRPEVPQHLTNCQYCSSQADAYQRMELKLISKLYRWDCPPNQTLGDYQFGLLSPQQSVGVKNHLSTCVLCKSELATLTEFLANDPMLVPSAQIAVRPAQNNRRPVQEAKRALENLRDQSLAGARRIIATPVPPQPRVAYQRDVVQPATLWPRRYTAEDLNISIQVEPGTSRRDALQVIGFVARKGTTLEALQGTPVQLVPQTNEIDTAFTQHIDELGNFIFPSITPATYTLELQLPEGVVVIEQLPVIVQD